MTPQPGTAGTDDDPLDSIETKELVVNGQTIDTLVGLAFDSANQTDGVLRFDGSGSTNGITDGSAKVIVNGTVYDVAGAEWVDLSGTKHTVDSWEKVVNSQFNVTITGTNGPVQPGNTLDVTADVSNAGTDQAQTVTLDIDNSVGQVDSTSVTLSGGGSTTQTLSWAVPSGQTEQDYTATVSSADDTASQTVTVSSVPPSLVSHWTFDTADTNSGTAVDTVGSNDGTIRGATTGVSGANQTYTTNEAYEFNGGSDVVDSFNTTDFTFGTDFSLAAWINLNGTGTRNPVLAKGSIRSGGDDKDYYIGTGGGNVFADVSDGSNSLTNLQGGSVPTNTWTHIAMTYDGSTLVIYIDGSQDTSASLSVSAQDDYALEIGNATGGGDDDGFNGKIDDPRVYSKALTSTEVSNLYTNGRI